jgi:hypothetical protein
VLALDDEQHEYGRGEQRGDDAAASREVGRDGVRERPDGEEPRSTLAPTQPARHHDHANARHGRDRGRRLRHAEGQDGEHRVQAAAQRRRRGDDHVN